MASRARPVKQDGGSQARKAFITAEEKLNLPVEGPNIHVPSPHLADRKLLLTALAGCNIVQSVGRDVESVGSAGRDVMIQDTDSLETPDDGSGDGEGCHEGLDVSVEAGRDASPVIEAAEHAIDDVALAVDYPVVVDLDLAVGLGWDGGRGAALGQPEPQGVAVVALACGRLL